MANSILVFLGHGIPSLGFIIWGVSLYITSLARRNQKSSLQLLARRAEASILLFGSVAVILFHCIVPPSRSYPELEHISMAVPFMIYALALQWKKMDKLPESFVSSIGAAAFVHELFLFHWHSTDHDGVEGHYHLLLQLTVLACVLFSIGEAILPRNKGIKLSRSIVIIFQGIWLFQLSFLLAFPSKFLPQGCQVFASHHKKIECPSQALVHQANAVGTLLFSWYFTLLLAATTISYALLSRKTAKPPFQLEILNVK